MESLNELKRSSVQKKVRAEARRAAFEAQVKTRHGEACVNDSPLKGRIRI